jgi:hypothetical protein
VVAGALPQAASSDRSNTRVASVGNARRDDVRGVNGASLHMLKMTCVLRVRAASQGLRCRNVLAASSSTKYPYLLVELMFRNRRRNQRGLRSVFR